MRPFLLLLAIFAGSRAVAGEWKRLPSLPDKEGFAGPFAGVGNGALLVAGGANFPDKKPWEGGKKVWSDAIFLLEKPDGVWKIVGRLPRPLGYGVSATYAGGVVCVGGSDGVHHYADAFRLDWRSGKLITTPLPSLPKPLANACGALVGDVLYIAGGQEKPEAAAALKTVYRIDLSAAEPKWKEIEAWPGCGRILAVSASVDGTFFLVGGVQLVIGKGEKVERRYLKDAYRYDPDNGWRRLPDAPRPVAAAPSPAPTDASGFFILGGDDGSQVGLAPDRHRGFGKKTFRFDSKSEKWAEAGETPAPRATVPCAFWDKSWVTPGGEVRPGVRSPEVWSFTPTEKK